MYPLKSELTWTNKGIVDGQHLDEANHSKPTIDKVAENTYACHATLYRPAAE